ncbi:hypothetical protein F4805DRAFT_441980 [Annulohypoxylon moriforme]|nr:hypothetical protein F4805DRAFT_441980 [Annulohypoxylon moriforme]
MKFHVLGVAYLQCLHTIHTYLPTFTRIFPPGSGIMELASELRSVDFLFTPSKTYPTYLGTYLHYRTILSHLVPFISSPRAGLRSAPVQQHPMA